MTKEQLNIWKENIFNSIKDISNLELQKLTWTGKHPIYVSSFSEIINTLYDDFEFEDYIDYIKKENEAKELYSKMAILNDNINKYLEIDKEDLDILEDSEWLKIVQIAKAVISIWITK